MSQAIANPSSEETNARFLLHLALWSGIYFTLVIAWGVRNSWPTELEGALLFFPLNLLLGWKLYSNNGWGLDTQDQPSEWELFMTYLLLAIGVASGLLLLMAIGWICIGFAWMRPRRDTLNWREWFKLPLLFFFCLPILLDLAGSRHDWFRFFGGHSSTLSDLPHDLIMTRLHVLAGLSVLVLAFFLNGALFWVSLPIVPLLLVANEFISDKLPSVWQNSEALTEFPRWLFVPLATIAYAFTLRFILRRTPSSRRILHTLTPWMQKRSFSPWLASLVILLQQSSLVASWLAEGGSRLELVGAIGLVVVLVLLRWRGTNDAVHSRSRILLAAALFVLLAGEWTDLDPLRHVSFGLLLIGLLSWRRTWPWHIFLIALFVWVMTLPATFETLVNMGLRDTTALAWRLIGFFLGMIILIAAMVRYRPQPALGTYDNYGWQPIKRLAFTLLALLLAFQTASSFWPEPAGKISADIFREDGRLVSVPKSSRPDGVAEVRYWRSTREGEDFNLLIARPANVPFQLDAPELILKGWGWQVVRRHLIHHATGQAIELRLTRSGQDGSALYWFEHGDRAFTNFLRGRQILWSGWNLTRRDLRLIMLYSEKEQDPKHLTRFAQSEEWFRQPPKSAE